MNKRLGFLSLIGVAALLLATFGANALAAPSGAAGTVAFDRTWTNLQNTIKVTVDDPDENKATLEVESSGEPGTPPYAIIEDTPRTFFPDEAPIADWVGIDQLAVDTTGKKTSVDDIVNRLNNELGTTLITRATFFDAAGVSGASVREQGQLDVLNSARKGNGLDLNDVLVVPASAAVKPAVIGIAGTSVIITSTEGSGEFALVYFGSQGDMVTVTLKSTSDQTGYKQTLTETGLNTGVFTGDFTLDETDTDAAGGELQAANGNVITVSYRDASEDVTRTDTLNVELGEPEVSNLTPASDSHTNASTLVLTGDLVDAQSGVKSKAIKFYISVDDGETFRIIPNEDDSGNDDFSNDEYNLTSITGGFQASVRVNLETRSNEQKEYLWYISAGDNAGNTGASKSDPDETPTGADNPHKFAFDNQPVKLTPEDTKAILGQWWDPTKKDAARLIDDATKSRNTSIRVIFDGALDGDSVDPGDFTVDGATVEEANWFSGKKDSVFLTVGEKGPSATPKVEVASGSIRDAAGNANALTLTVKTAKDGLAPSFTVDVSGDDTGGDVAVSDKDITITITANETLLTNPTIKVGRVEENAAGDLVMEADTQLVVGGSLTFLGNDRWRRKLSVGSFLNSRTGGDPRAFVVTVSGTDTASNIGSSGSTDPEKSSAILFEMDNGIPEPVLDPGDEGVVTRDDPFINVDWSGEGSEYDGDTHKKVTLTVLTLDGEDVLDRVATTNNRSFVLTTSGLSLGDHKVVVNGTDEVGNKLSKNHEITFTVKARPKNKIPLKPGTNLVSFPGDPADSSINSVVTLSQVTAITTYDAATSTWLSATRDDSGNLSGDLEQIDAQHAYWVSTTSFDPISVDIPRQGFGSVPPAITLVEGWNLVPVVVVGDQTVKTIAADTYFGSTSWVTAYTFDPQDDQWTKVLPGNFHDVEVGKGYWLYVEQAGVLVP